MTEKTLDKTKKKPICLFHDEWLEDPKLKGWLAKTDNLTGNCKVCRKNIKLGTMDVSAIRSHMTRRTVHKERMKSKSALFDCVNYSVKRFRGIISGYTNLSFLISCFFFNLFFSVTVEHAVEKS